jgi:hypothetical protein
MDPTLLPVLDAASEEERESALASLLELQMLPLARAIVGRKLRTYSSRPEASDREDVVSEAMLTLIERLRALTAGEAAPIENLPGYAATIVHSACAHYVRRQYPERARLKARLRYVLSTAAALSIWSIADDDLACGRSNWRGQPADTDAAERIREAAARQAHAWTELRPAALARALTAVFSAAGGPVLFDTLVAAIAAASNLQEPRPASDLDRVSVGGVAQDLAVDQRRLLERVWQEVRELPLGQRTALLLNLRGTSGNGVLWLLPVAGVASIRQIARVLEIDDDELARLWSEIPLDDESIARRLGCTRQQVINLRMAGRKRLSNRLRDRLGVLSSSSRRANFRGASSSQKGSD